MLTKTLWIIFLASFFAAIVHTKPAVENEDHFKDFNLCKLKNIYADLASKQNEKTLKPTVQLIKFFLFDLYNIGLRFARKAKNITDLMYKDPIVTASKSPEALVLKEHIKEYDIKYKTCGNMVQLFGLMSSYLNVASQFYVIEDISTANADLQAIYKIWKVYDPKDLNDEFENDFFNIFFNKFQRKIADLKEDLRKEGELGLKILEWWNRMKTLQTNREKMKAFVELMNLYNINGK